MPGETYHSQTAVSSRFKQSLGATPGRGGGKQLPRPRIVNCLDSKCANGQIQLHWKRPEACTKLNSLPGTLGTTGRLTRLESKPGKPGKRMIGQKGNHMADTSGLVHARLNMTRYQKKPYQDWVATIVRVIAYNRDWSENRDSNSRKTAHRSCCFLVLLRNFRPEIEQSCCFNLIFSRSEV